MDNRIEKLISTIQEQDVTIQRLVQTISRQKEDLQSATTLCMDMSDSLERSNEALETLMKENDELQKENLSMCVRLQLIEGIINGDVIADEN